MPDQTTDQEPGERVNERWDSSAAPGGWVCATCGTPTETEPCPQHGADSPEPATRRAEHVATPPADPGAHPDTPPHTSGILGRALLDGDGSLWWWSDEDDCWRSGQSYVDHPAGPVREVLLVDPDAWERRERVVDAADMFVGAMQDAGLAQVDPLAAAVLAAAVGALTGGSEPQVATGPDPEPAGDGPGWKRHVIEAAISVARAVPSGQVNLPGAHIEGLLAERDRLERDLEHARADRQDLWDTRDKRNHRWMEAAERLTEERDTARAELAEVTARRDAIRDERDMLRTIRERNHATMSQLRHRAEAAEIELATARRDTAAATLDWAAWCAGIRAAPTIRDHLLDAAREIRAGKRDVPGSEETP